MSLFTSLYFITFFFFTAERVADTSYALPPLQCCIEDIYGKEVLATMKERFSAFIDLPKVCSILSSFLNNSIYKLFYGRTRLINDM